MYSLDNLALCAMFAKLDYSTIKKNIEDMTLVNIFLRDERSCSPISETQGKQNRSYEAVTCSSCILCTMSIQSNHNLISLVSKLSKIKF